MIWGAAARGKSLAILAALGVCATLAGAALADPQQAGPSSQTSQGIIERIEFSGNRRVQQDTLKARIFSRPGDPYSDEAVRRDFQALWNTQFFESIRLEVEPAPGNPNNKIVVFYVTERPIIRRIEYKGNKSVSESDILDRFKERKVGLSVESQFDPTKIKRAEVVLKELLAEHGHQFATVRPTYERIAAANAVKLVFDIDEGPKVKVGHILIEGNRAFSSRRIIRAMRHDRPIGIPLWLTSIDLWSKTFDRSKLDEDLEVGIRGLYQNHGYFKVVVRDPVLKTVDEDRAGIPGPWPMVGSKHGKRTDITIPIEEGERYRMGKLLFRSADPDKGLTFKTEFLAKVFPLREGEIFSAEKIRKALDNYRKLYGEYGFIDFTPQPLTDVDEEKKVINITMEFDEQKMYFVRRIEFTGNTTTRDKVIRRELLIDEGQVFNNRLWELSLLRLNQLDYFDQIKPENAELKKNVKTGAVDINLKVKEKGKQSISFSGGVSGIGGSFIGMSYQTNNFLGLGETLSVAAQVGDFQRNISFGFTEPYLFDRPISTGFTVFFTRFDYNQQRQTSLLFGQNVPINPLFAQNYDTDSRGFTVYASYPLRKFSFTRLGVTYGFNTTDIKAISQTSQLFFQSIQFRSLAGPNALKGIQSSSIQPTLSYSTVNSPVNPTAGKSFFYGFRFEGGPLGGNIRTLTNTFSTSYFHPVGKRNNVLAFHFTSAFATGYGGDALPPQSRFYSGGENDIRGFDFFTISPFVFLPNSSTTQIFYQDPTKLDQGGNPTLQALTVPVLQILPFRAGGDTQGVGNVEYRIPIAGPVTLSFFTDVGANGIARPSQLQLSPSATSLLQEQYPNTFFPNTKISNRLQVVPGTSFKPRSSSGIEIGVQLPIVNAPFRFYYAYNTLRLDETISAPRGAFFLSDQAQRTLPPGVLQAQILPQLNTILDQQIQRFPTGLIEPRHTFRFTVGKTF